MKWLPKSWPDRCSLLLVLVFLGACFFIARHSNAVSDARELREERIEHDIQTLRDEVRSLRERLP